MAFDAAEGRPVENHCSPAGPVDAGDRVEARGLAGAVGADQTQDLPAPDIEAHRIQRDEPAEADREIPCLQENFAFCRVHLAVQAGHFVDT